MKNIVISYPCLYASLLFYSISGQKGVLYTGGHGTCCVTSSHRVSRRLFNSLTADPVTWSGTFTRFVSLLNNYEIATRTPDEYTMGEKAEIDGFLDAILPTDVVRYLEDFLVRKGGFQGCGLSGWENPRGCHSWGGGDPRKWFRRGEGTPRE